MQSIYHTILKSKMDKYVNPVVIKRLVLLFSMARYSINKFY